MSAVQAVAALFGAIANVLALCLALRAKRKRFARALDKEIRGAVWAYHITCLQNGSANSLDSLQADEISRYFESRSLHREAAPAIRDASLQFVHESLTWRLASYKPSVPRWALSLLPQADAYRYNLEWGAHLRELVDDSHVSRVRGDRLRFALAAISFAVVLRARRLLRYRWIPSGKRPT